MTSVEIRKKFLDFFKTKRHVIVPSSSLLSDDPSVLLTTAGVQQFKPYYTGELNPEKDFGSRRVVSVQKCFRTSDIDVVGDETHLTFFEMLGNFSFGDYWKKEAIHWAYEFITKELGVDKKRITVSVFGGANSISRDNESYDIWQQKIGVDKKHIKEAGMEDNFWGPTGSSGPCGPTTEIYVDGIEVWNIVFNEYFSSASRDVILNGSEESYQLKKLKTPGIDTGMGLERLAAVLANVDSVFEIDLLKPLVPEPVEGLQLNERTKRILADHVRGIVFLIADGVRPSNKEAGYILRRLIRRVITLTNRSLRASSASRRSERGNLFLEFVTNLLSKTILLYQKQYPELKSKIILPVFDEEQAKFQKTLSRGLKELNTLKNIDAQQAFKLFETFGLPYEVIKDVAGSKAKKLKREDFDKEFAHHQAISRAGLEKKFGGHGLLLDTGELKAADEAEVKKVTQLHTATHLLQQALRDVFGEGVRQKGSDINISRTRFDFSFARKLEGDEIKKIEEIVNKKIKDNLLVKFEEMPLAMAKKSGALYLPDKKYPDPVKVYFVGKTLKTAYSKELCGGPHVAQTGEIGSFKITKEEGVGAGLRRIRATVS